MCEEEKKSFDRIPSYFLKDVFIVPNNFTDPENKDHAEFVNQQMRNDLFNDTFSKITDVELYYLKDDNGFVKLKNISECTRNSILNYGMTKYYTSKDDYLIKCEKWTMNINNQQETDYEINYYQTENDRFFQLIFPPNLRKQYRLFRQNYNFF